MATHTSHTYYGGHNMTLESYYGVVDPNTVIGEEETAKNKKETDKRDEMLDKLADGIVKNLEEYRIQSSKMTDTKMANFFKQILDGVIYSEEFNKIWHNFINSDIGVDFFVAPASVRYHGSYKGGLADHSLAVLEALIKTRKVYGLNIGASMVLSALFHDLCKARFYKPTKKPIKNKEGVWESRDTWEYNNEMPSIQHGPESLRRLFNMGLGLYIDEPWQLAIAYHMGVFNTGNDETMKFSQMCEVYPEVLALHHADMIASKIYKI